MLEFRALGPLEVVGAEGPVALGGVKPRLLLALLLIRAGRVVSIDQLVDELWGARPPRTAPTAVHNMVSQLRKQLGADTIVTRAPGYLLDVHGHRVDIALFEKVAASARRTTASERVGQLDAALAMWRGPAFADLAFENAVQDEARRLDDLRVAVLADQIETELEFGGRPDLLSRVERLVSEHPEDERLRGLLIVALYKAGRQADAVRSYEEARAALAELGIRPGPALRSTYSSILRQDLGIGGDPRREIEADFDAICAALRRRQLIPILGERPVAERTDGSASPSRHELVELLAGKFSCPARHARNLAAVAEYIAMTHGIGPLYDELHSLFGKVVSPAAIHLELAQLARSAAEAGSPLLLIVTTRFDDALERALVDAGVSFDVVAYLALGPHHGKFVHVPADGPARPIDLPNAYTAVEPDRQPVILKVHGGVERTVERQWESFAVSEDDHIDYLAQVDVATVLPVTVAARLRHSHLLFLEYSLSDWSLRVFLHRVFGRDKLAYRSWAVLAQADRLERQLWAHLGIETVISDPAKYSARLGVTLAHSGA